MTQYSYAVMLSGPAGSATVRDLQASSRYAARIASLMPRGEIPQALPDRALRRLPRLAARRDHGYPSGVHRAPPEPRRGNDQ